MANPKLENGYTRIAHELLEQFALADFSGAEFKILLAVIRHTYGFQRKSATISMHQFSIMCGLHTITVSKTIKKLLEKKVLIEKSKPGFTTSREVAINKNHHAWLVKQTTVSQNETVSQTANTTVSQTANTTVSQTANHTKDNIKNTIKDRESTPSLESIKSFSIENGLDEQVAEKFFKYYDVRGWLTNGGTNVATIWQSKLAEWNKNEIKKVKSEKNEISCGCYDRSLVEKLINKD